MSNSKVIGGRSLPPANRWQAGGRPRRAFLLPAAHRLVPKPRAHHHGSSPLDLHTSSRLPSTEARRLEPLSSRPPLHRIERTARTNHSCFETAKRMSVGENASLLNMEKLSRIRKQLMKPRLSPSPYDTAWVAMVHLPASPHIPCFPQCVEWILQNQHNNGSWGHNQIDSSVNKDILSSTLACVLALKRWNVGTKHIKRGLVFIGRYFSTVMDEQALAPIGFNIIFSGMLNLATRMDLEFPVKQADVHHIHHLREMELKSFWMQRDEEIMLDVATCAMAFRLLRMNGYDVSSDELGHVDEASTFQNALQGYLNDTKAILELYKASKVNVFENDCILDKIGYWSGSLLTQKLLSDGEESRETFGEIEYALKFPFYATMDRLDHKRNIEHFDASYSRMLKTEYLPCCVNQEILGLAVEDFVFSQSVYQDELRHLESWAKKNRLDQLQFARDRITYCHFAAAGTIFPPELSDARISWAKSSILVIITDDFFDVAGSKEELENLVALVEKWDEHSKEDFYSERVKILFYAIYTTINQLGEMASTVQNRDVRKHMIELWLQLLMSMMTEANWRMRQYMPTIEEYMETAVVSFTLGPLVLPGLYFVGQSLSECIVKHQEYNELFTLMSTCGRLLNDIQGFERESSQGKLESVSLLVLHSDGCMSIEAAKESIRRCIDSCRKDLLRLVLKEDSVVPKPCRELFWKMSKICHVFYSHTDGFTSPIEMVSAANAIIHEPLNVQMSN